MGQTLSTGTSRVSSHQQYAVQSKSDWDSQMEKLLKSKQCVIKTVILPPGVTLDDDRLKTGQVVEEKIELMKPGELGEFPTDVPFEADVHGDLIPPCWGSKGTVSHFSVYPDERFNKANNKCELCALRRYTD